jgi:hypothetical protein
VESAAPPQLAFDFWPLLSQWLGHYWPWLGISGIGILIFFWWDWLLARDWGRFWPVPAAFLPALIPFARDWQKTAPSPLKGCSVSALLLAVAVLQIYGQERNNNDRNQQATRIDRIATGVEQQGAEVRRGFEQQGAELRRLTDAIADLASEAQEETSDREVD